MDFEIAPLAAAGPVRFGMTAEETRRALGKPSSTFKKASSAAFPADAFDEQGVHVYYKASGVCEAVEFGPPARPTLGGEALLGRPFRDVELLLRRLDAATKVDEGGLTSYALGISLYCPGREEDPQAAVAGVLVFEKGYYG